MTTAPTETPTPAPTETPTPVPTPEAEFAAAFDEAASDAPATAPAPTPAPTETPAEGAPTETPAEETPTETPAEGAPTETPAEETPTETPAEETPTETPVAAVPSADEVVRALLEQAKAAGAPPATDPEPEAAPQEPPVYTAEEQKALDDFAKDWPDVDHAQKLQRRAEYADLTRYIFNEVYNFMRPALDQVAAMGNTLHTAELTTKVPDYSPDLEQQVMAWVEQQPKYLQAGMKQVMQSGTSDEVADLFGRFRADQPASQAPTATTPSQTPPVVKPAKTELSSAAKQAAESLAPVGGDRTVVPQGDDPQDFKSAFEKYATAEST